MKRSKITDEPAHLPLHVFLVIFTLLAIYPVLWVFTIAFSGGQSLAIADLPSDPTFLDRLRAILPWPEQVSLSNFRSVMTDQPFARWILNSAVVAAATTVLGVFLATTAGYAFSRFRFPGQRTGLMSFLVSQMFPGTLMLIPLYIIIVGWLGLGSTWIGLILVYATTSIPFCVWMLKGYFDTIPLELEESARIDGATPIQIFIKIILPLAKPAVAVTALFSATIAFAQNDSIQRCLFERQFGEAGHMLAAHDQFGAWESNSNVLHDFADIHPVGGEHASQRDDFGILWNTFDNVFLG